jgi:hypothetical protein
VRTLLGNGAVMELQTIADEDDGLQVPRDLAFHPGREGELWIVNRADDSVTIVFDATGAAERTEHRIDAYALHFMEEVSSIAMGADTYRGDYTFGTCQESRNTYNHQTHGNDFMGPALWSTRLDVFAVANPIGLGSHIDMLHESPLCMGIAHEKDNVYWVFDGLHSMIARYDFQRDHDAGYDDHSDGLIRFYDEPELERVEDVPGHMVMDQASGTLYVADTGNGRVIAFDTASGSRAGARRAVEPGTKVDLWRGATWREVVVPGTVSRPSGLALHEGLLYVGDNQTGVIHAFDTAGQELDQLETGTGTGLMGIEVGPDGRLYAADAEGHRVLRIAPR